MRVGKLFCLKKYGDSIEQKTFLIWLYTLCSLNEARWLIFIQYISSLSVVRETGEKTTVETHNSI